MTIGEKIKGLRQENHMTQEALAKRLHISSQAVSKWEQNLTAPDISLLGDIAECFQVTTDELLGAGRYKRASGYKTYRARLLAVYEESGAEEDFQRAVAAYNDVLLGGTADTEDFLLYGWLYENRARRDAEMARRYYEKAIDAGRNTRDGSWFRAHVQLSRLLAARGTEAVDRWKAWLEQEPESLQARLALIWALYFAGRAEEALPYAEQSEQMAREDPFVLTAMGDILGGEKGLGRYEEAIGYWDRALTANDDFGDCRYSKARAYEQLGRQREAVAEYEEICRWLRFRGMDTGAETRYPEEKIRELSQMLEA